MEKKVVSAVMLAVLLAISMLTLALNIQPVKASGTIYIRADGSVDPPTAPIQRDGDLYTFTDNIYESIVVERNNTVIDGAGYTLQGGGEASVGISLERRSNVTIKNIKIRTFITNGVWLSGSSNNTVSGNYINIKYGPGVNLLGSSNFNTISGNTITNNWVGIQISESSNNSIIGNNIAYNQGGVYLGRSSNNRFYHNSFIDNIQQVDSDGSTNVWDDGYPSGGNYWSDYTGVDYYSGPYQNETGSDGIGDTAYANTDRYPLMMYARAPEVQVGVKASDWIKVEYTISGWPSGQPYPEWLKVEFLSVEGTNATIQVTMRMSDGTEQSDTVPVDVVAGGQALGLSGFVIPANLTTGDYVYITGYGNIPIASETTGTYAGASRTVVYASISQYWTQLTYYWDKQTGVMVEASTTSGGVTATAKATETNMWQLQPFGLPIDPTLFYALIIVAIVVVAALAFFMIRRRKKPPKEIEPPKS